MNAEKFAKGVERLINPMEVGTLHFLQAFNSLMPTFLQKFLVESSSKKIPFMGFVVEPYATFLCYEIEDIPMAQSLLPSGFELIKTSIFNDDEPKFYCILSAFTAHTSAFWGSRVEFYVIAKDQSTGLLSWLIVDYDSNTISYDTRDGLRKPNSKSAVVTTNHRGMVYVDVPKDDLSRDIKFNVNLEGAVFKPLDQRLWLEGNLSIGYGKSFSQDKANIFSLKFDPLEVEKGLFIPLQNVNIETNTWYKGLFKPIPAVVAVFPYAQHFVSDSPGSSSKIKNKEELESAIETVDFDNLEVFSTKSFKVMFAVGALASAAITLTLLILLILK